MVAQAGMQTAAWGASASAGVELGRSSAARVTPWGLPGGSENPRNGAEHGAGSAEHRPSGAMDVLCQKLDGAIRWERQHGFMNSKVGPTPFDSVMACAAARYLERLFE